MEELFAKMSEFIKMDEEIPTKEFTKYYQAVIGYLMESYQDMSTDDLIKAQGITSIMASNAQMRAARKDENRKKYSKMGDKSAFWEKAIKLRLTNEGMSAEEVDEKVAALWND